MDSIQPLDTTPKDAQRATVLNPLTGEEDTVLTRCEHCNADDRKLTYVSESHIALCPDCLRTWLMAEEASDELERVLAPVVSDFIERERARGLHDLALLDIVLGDPADIVDRAVRRVFGKSESALREELTRKIQTEISGKPS